MATATSVTTTITSITLDLSMQEAMFLRGLLFCHITGPDAGPRGLSNAIGNALAKAGVLPANYRAIPGDQYGTIEYPDQPLVG